MRTPEAWLQDGLLGILADGFPRTAQELAIALEPKIDADEVQVALEALADQGLVRSVATPPGSEVPTYRIVATDEA